MPGTPAAGPSIRPPLMILAAVFVGWWAFHAVVFSMRSYYTAIERGVETGWLEASRLSLLAAAVLALMSLVALTLAWYLPLERGQWRRSLAIHLLAAVVVLVARALIYHTIGQYTEWMPAHSLGRRLQAMPVNFLIYSTFVGFGYGLAYYYRSREQEVRNAQLRAGLARTQLKALQMQLHPQFLFSTLRGIADLMHRDVRAADRMVARLGDLLRLMLERNGADEVTLKEEFDFLEAYLAIEQIRLGDRLQVEWKIDPEALDARVPHLILQPLVENAIRLGIASSATPRPLVLSAERANGALHLQVLSDGAVQPADAAAEPDFDADAALNTTRLRLEQLYNGGHWMELLDTGDNRRGIRVEIPFSAAGAPSTREPAPVPG